MRPAFALVPWPTAGKTSNPIKMDGNQIVGFLLPATTVSTSFTFNMARTLSTSPAPVWVPVADSSGSAISFTTTASTSKYYGFSQDQIAKFTGTELLQLMAGSTEAANQAIYISIIPRPSQ